MGNRRERLGSGRRNAGTLGNIGRELQRVNRTLRRLAAEPGRARPQINGVSVRAILAARRMRDDCFGPDVGDLAWTLLLEAYAARLEGRLSVMTGLGAPAGIARSTAHRWAAWLLDRGLLTRHADPEDERIVLIGVSDDAAENIRAYLAAAIAQSPWLL